jgi:hypothetical protein
MNRREENQTPEPLANTEHLRTVLKTELNKLGVTKHWAVDRWRDLLGAKSHYVVTSPTQVMFTIQEQVMRIS